MKIPSETFVVGSRRKRRSIRGENWLEPNWTASRRIEKTKPVKVIMPPASAPSTDLAASAPKEIADRRVDAFVDVGEDDPHRDRQGPEQGGNDPEAVAYVLVDAPAGAPRHRHQDRPACGRQPRPGATLSSAAANPPSTPSGPAFRLQ